MPEVVAVKSSKEERLPIVISFEEKEQILAVPKLGSSSGKNQANAVLNTLNDWNLNDKVQIMCCDTTASNIGRLNGACMLLEQALERELLLFACRHHVYELVLKSVFQTKIQEDSTSPEIPLFKKFKNNWKNINPNAIEPCSNFVKQHFCETMINELVEFYYNELEKSIVRDDYRELIELAIIFLGGNSENKIKIRPPGALHQARWMARAIYSIKICLLQSQFKMSVKDEQALRDISLFIVTVYVKPWLRCSLAVKAPNQDLLFLKTLKDYERVDKLISKAALGKFSHHLWYLSEEITRLSIFDDDVDEQNKKNIVINLKRESFDDSGKRYVPSKDETSLSLYEKSLSDFITIRSKIIFSRLKVDCSFLQENISSWEENVAYIEAKKKILCLKAVNDTAERAVKLMQNFHGLITAEEEQKQFLLRCVQEHRDMYPECKKQTLKRKCPE